MSPILAIPTVKHEMTIGITIIWISRRKIDPNYEGYIHTAGLVLLLALMAYVMYNDISKLVT